MTYSREGGGAKVGFGANGPCWVAAGTALIKEKGISWVLLFVLDFFSFVFQMIASKK